VANRRTELRNASNAVLPTYSLFHERLYCWCF
jgi:hypothetical protein